MEEVGISSLVEPNESMVFEIEPEKESKKNILTNKGTICETEETENAHTIKDHKYSKKAKNSDNIKDSIGHKTDKYYEETLLILRQIKDVIDNRSNQLIDVIKTLPHDKSVL